ncbi:hypothetical protein [Spirochaeta thermophila]|uniref:Uncharacterized protein n=1 Tax=Winmispira thermophila (strain ATCC 49972 / DSM 6192 / RI 19.B1) TaxID=665571 RepID=E0RSA6_WINT6|nr:hypothetical protein [Spirochaeta thermophila]ADN01893.1 hypothetical protein STHERM_c09470 [Spirochaeta thermophila DSM 6192]
MESFITIFLYSFLIALPLLLIPLLMRFLVSTVVLLRARRKFFPLAESQLETGWNEEDRILLQKMEQYIRERIKTYSLLQFNLLQDIKELLLTIETHYHPDIEQARTPRTLRYSFSIRRLLECTYLALDDLILRSRKTLWFSTIKRIRLIWFYRTRHLQAFYSALMKWKPIRILWRSRILGKIIALTFLLLAFPVIGLPAILLYSVRSTISSLLIEGMYRLFYASLLYQISYYGLFLYGRKNPLISDRIEKLSPQTLREQARRIEERLATFWKSETTPIFPEALEAYQRTLKEIGLPEDPVFTHREAPSFLQHLSTTLQSLLHSAGKAYQEMIIPPQESRSYLDELLLIYSRTGSLYAPGGVEPLFHIRTGHLLTGAHALSVLLLSLLYGIPGGKLLSGSITVEFIVGVQETIQRPPVKTAMDVVTGNLRQFGLLRKVGILRQGIHGLRRLGHVVTEFVLPPAFRFIQDAFRREIYYRTGRLLLYTWEESTLKHPPLALFDLLPR